MESIKMRQLKEFLSTYAEIHAFVHGIYAGLTEWKGIDSETMKNPDVVAEIAYTKGGYVLGTILRVAIILLVGKMVLGS